MRSPKLGRLDPQSRVRLAQTLRKLANMNPAAAPTARRHAANLMALNAIEARGGLPKMPKSLLERGQQLMGMPPESAK